jgi:soluble lytic murein transglycosylase-like protein
MFKLIRRLVVIFVIFFGGYQIYVTHQNVQNVLKYKDLVEETLAENDTAANVELVLAMIYTETKGNTDDVMQSSESVDGIANSITDSRTSIQQGVTVLSENLTLANESQVDVWTAVQAYNYGTAYINYVSKNGGKNTIELAKIYSRDVVAPSLGNTSGETYFYYHPLALISGGRLYKNGGNIYYSREVHFNLYLLEIMSLF